jgi:hypothetical protein
MLVPEEGVEPTRPCDQRILSPPRLPFRHSGTCAVTLSYAGSCCNLAGLLPPHWLSCRLLPLESITNRINWKAHQSLAG